MQTNYAPHDYAQTFLNAFKLRLIAGSSCALAVVVTIAGVTVSNAHVKTLLLTSALGLTVVSRMAEDARTVSDRIALDVTDISDAARQQQLYEAMTKDAEVVAIAPEEEPSEAIAGPNLYDLKEITKENHTAVVGASGSGKSFLTQWLVSTYFPSGSNIIALDTDASPSDWSGLPVVGRGGNIEAIKKQMQADLKELAKRTELKAEGKPVGAEEVRIVEEYPSLSADVTDQLNKGESNISQMWLKKLLRRGRKYSLKVVLVSQEFEVKSLGIAGEGGLRNAFTIIYLGKVAFAQLDQVRDTAERDQLRAWLNQQRRPALVQSGGSWFACVIPDIKSLPAASAAGDNAEPYSEEEGMVFEYLADDDETLDDSVYSSMPAGSTAGAVAVVQVADGLELHENTLRYLHGVIEGHKRNGLTKTQILKELGYHGRRYREGLELWDKLDKY